MIYAKIFAIFFGLGLLSFGGVFGVLPLLQSIIVERYHWITAEQFVQSYIVGQFVPGPNMAMCPLLGYQIAGVGGAVAAYFGIYSGPVMLMVAAERLYRRHRHRAWVRRAELALRPLVFGLICSATALFLRQEAGGEIAAAVLLGLPLAALNHWRKLGALTCIAAFGLAWWGLHAVGWR